MGAFLSVTTLIGVVDGDVAGRRKQVEVPTTTTNLDDHEIRRES